MTQIQCLAVATATPDAVRHLAGDGATLWYAADSFGPLADLWAADMPRIKIEPMSAAINEVVLRHRKALIEIVDTLFPCMGEAPIAWAASNVGDRGPYLSPYIRNIVRRVVIAEGVARGGRHIIVADDLASAEAFAGKGPSTWERILCVVAGIRARLAGLRVFARMQRATSVSDGQAAKFKDIDQALIVWSGPDWHPGGSRQSALGRLPEVLRSCGHTVGLILNPLLATDDLCAVQSGIDASPEPAMLISALMTWVDFIRALPGSMALLSNFKGQAQFADVDIAGVTELMLWRDMASFAPVYARLFRRVGARLRKKFPKVMTLGHVYENQPWEKCLHFGLRDTPIRTVGVQHSPFAYDYLAFFPDAVSRKAALVPDHLCVPGSTYADWFGEVGFRESDISVIGALRFEAMYARNENSAVAPQRRDTFTVLCALSIELNESMELAHTVLSAIAKTTNTTVIFSFHYAMDDQSKKTIQTMIERSRVSAEITEQKSAAFIDRTDLVAYNTTGTAFDFLAQGIPVAFVGRHAVIDHDKVPEGMSHRVRSSEELALLVDGLVTGRITGPDRKTAFGQITTMLGPVRPDRIKEAFERFRTPSDAPERGSL